VFDNTERTFLEALNFSPYPGCFLAPPKEVQDSFDYLTSPKYEVELPPLSPWLALPGSPADYSNMGWKDTSDQGWVGAWKDIQFLAQADGTLLPPNGVDNWETIDGSPWHVTGKSSSPTYTKYWDVSEPKNGVPPKGRAGTNVFLSKNGLMRDGPPSVRKGAWYKCCQNSCQDVGQQYSDDVKEFIKFGLDVCDGCQMKEIKPRLHRNLVETGPSAPGFGNFCYDFCFPEPPCIYNNNCVMKSGHLMGIYDGMKEAEIESEILTSSEIVP
jgi:hypothetical protein